MIQEIGCTQDGGVWMSLLIEVNGEQQKAILPMDAKKAIEVRDALNTAIEQGEKWRETGVAPYDGEMPVRAPSEGGGSL